MVSVAITPDQYTDALPEDRREAVSRLRQTLVKHLPKGFEECMTYGMISYVVPHSLYPAGYHCDPKLPLGYISVASQKNYVALHHLGLYMDNSLLEWFQKEYPKHSKTKLDMGKGCVRFKKPDAIPFELIAELAAKMSAQEWIEKYESVLKR